jgi:hypothetical protein
VRKPKVCWIATIVNCYSSQKVVEDEDDEDEDAKPRKAHKNPEPKAAPKNVPQRYGLVVE